MIFAPKFPLRFKEQKGFENVQNAKELIRFHLMNVLMTSPGEKISDPNFGVGIRKYLFENMTAGLINNLRDIIGEQLATYASYVSTTSIEILPFPEQSKLIISIAYDITNTRDSDVINLEFSGTPSSGPSY